MSIQPITVVIIYTDQGEPIHAQCIHYRLIPFHSSLSLARKLNIFVLRIGKVT